MAKKEKAEQPVKAPVEQPVAPEVAEERTEQHPITGAPVKVPVFVPSVAFPINPDCNQAVRAHKGDFIVEWVEQAIKVEFAVDKDRKVPVDNIHTNTGRSIPMLHTRLFALVDYGDDEDTARHYAEVLAKKKPGAKIYQK